MSRSLRFLLTSIVSLMALSVSEAQIVIDNSLTPQQLVQDVLVGEGVEISNVTFTGNILQIGSFVDASGSNFPISEGLVMSTGSVLDVPGASGDFASTGHILPGDSDLDLVSSMPTQDAAILTFDFVPIGDSIRFNYIFGSEEYPEFVGSNFNDVFAFIISGPGFNGPFANGGVNLALLPGTTTAVTIDNVNDGTNSQFYVDNSGGGANGIVFDGHTVTLTALAQVECGETYTLKIAIADAGDGSYDSGVFLEARSFFSNAIEIEIATLSADSTIVEGCTDATVTFTRPETDTDSVLAVPLYLSGNAVNGVNYTGIPDTLVFEIGESEVTFTIVPLEDGVVQTVPDTIIITVYTVTLCGDSLETVGVVYIQEEYELDVALSNELVGCAGLYGYSSISSEVSGGNPPYYYEWSNGEETSGIEVAPPVETTYTLTVTDSCGMGSQTISITVPASNSAPMPIIAVSSDVVLDCPGEVASLTAIATGGTAPYNYSWTGGQTGSTVSVQPSDSTYYVISVTDACYPGPVRDTVHVAVVPYTPPTIAVTDTLVPCPGNDLLAEVILEGGTSPVNIVWSNGMSGTQNTLNPLVDESIVITATDACGTEAEETLDITVTQYPALTASIHDTLLSVLDTVAVCELWSDTLWAAASGGLSPYTYSWQGALVVQLSADNDSVRLVVPYALPPDSIVSETYSVTVTDQCGVAVTVPVVVNVRSCDIIQPGIFSPSSDHVGAIDYCGSTPQNNVFHLPCLELYPGNKLTIFDRWGRNCYEKENYHLDPWDGDGATAGVYFYVLEVPGRSELLKGFFHLVQ